MYLSGRYGDNGDESNHYTNFSYEQTSRFSLNHTWDAVEHRANIVWPKDISSSYQAQCKGCSWKPYIYNNIVDVVANCFICMYSTPYSVLYEVCRLYVCKYNTCTLEQRPVCRSLIRIFVEVLVHSLLIIKWPEDLKSLPGHCHRSHSPLENYNKGAYGMALLFNLWGQDGWSLCWQHRS